MKPTSAVISVIHQCNSHCVMCDIWRSPSADILDPEVIKKLPRSLIDINITGGEPFLHPQLTRIIENINKLNAKSQIIINTNGFNTKSIIRQSINILEVSPKIGIRVSLDGFGKLHSQIRGIKCGWTKATRTIYLLRQIGVKNLGVSFTIMDRNYHHLPKIFRFCQKNNLELSLTLASDSPIYFGQKKIDLRPKDSSQLISTIGHITSQRFKSLNPKEWARGYFDYQLAKYNQTNQRPIPCHAGENSFFIDHQANIYICHLKNWLLGNLHQSNVSVILKKADNYLSAVHQCQDCWMVCSFKPSLRYHLPTIIFSIIRLKLFHET